MKYRLNQEGKGLKIQVEWVHEKVIGNAYLKKKNTYLALAEDIDD